MFAAGGRSMLRLYPDRIRWRHGVGLGSLVRGWRTGLVALVVAVVLGPVGPASAAVPTPAPPGRESGAGESGPARGQGRAQERAAPGGAGSTIVGGVLLDEDLSGTPSRGDRPLVGITVSIGGNGAESGVATGGDGSFAFSNLSAGSYTISIGLPAGVTPLNGTSQTVTVDGRGGGRVDFFVGRPQLAPTAVPVPPTPTPVPPMPTSTPRPLPTPVPAPRVEPSGGTRGPNGQSLQNYQAPSAPPPITTSYGPRYAPGRGNPSAIQPVQKENALWLGVPFITQNDGTTYSEVNCGPASTTMILAAFGIRTTPAAVRNYVNSMSGVYSAGVGTSLDQLGRVLRESGLEVSDLYSGQSYRRWSTDLLREHVLAGHPVMTLVKYRALPGHTGSWAEFDHYILISGVSGDDFIYNDAAYSGDRGYGLLISPRDLERAWDYSSIPRHGIAVSLGSGDRPASEGEPGGELALAADEQLEAAELSLGDEMRLLDSFGGLTFRRVELDDQKSAIEQPPAPSVGALELAEFVPLLEEDWSRIAADQASHQTSVQPRLWPFLPDLGGHLMGLGAGLVVLLLAVGVRRMVE